MSQATVLGVSSRALIAACQRLGFDTAALLAAARIDPDELARPDARFSVRQVAALWSEALARSSSPDLGLRAAEALPFGAYTVIDFLCRSSATIGEGLSRIARYFPLINSSVELPIEIERDAVTFGMVDLSAGAEAVPAYVEYTLAAVFLRTRLATGVPFQLLRVELAHRAPSDTRTHARIFGCTVRFGSKRSQLVLPRAAWDSPIGRADPALAAYLEQHAGALLAQLPQRTDTASATRTALLRELDGGEPTLDRVASLLGTSGRALQRKLADEGHSFAQLLAELRESLARSHLARNQLSISEIAHLLGFSELSSFGRAFKKWTGQSPVQYRAAARRPPARAPR